MTAREDAVREKLARYGQEHVLRFWDQLDAAQREELLSQIERIDFDLTQRLVDELLEDDEAAGGPAELEPAPVIGLPDDAAARARHDEARRHGEKLLSQGKVATFVVAGGQGSRLGLDGPKGAFEVGPVTDRTLFQIHAEKVLAMGERHGVRIPWLLMTSEANHEDTVAFFEEHDHFGLRTDDVLLFQQAMLPAVDRKGKFFLESPGRIFTSPNGHGGSIQALADSGALKELKQRGIEYIFYFQVDNPLVSVCDPTFIGFHALEDADMSSKVVRKRDWSEKVGVVGLRNGELTVIEYSDLSEDEARATLDDGSLKYWAGSVAIHVLSVDFVESLNAGGFNLPFHRAEKAIPHVDENGEPVKPEGKNGVKFETFVFDALGKAKRSVTLEARREDEFSPVKNAEGEDSPKTCRDDMTALYLRWLEAAGARIERGAGGKFDGHVELSPLRALDAEHLRENLAANTVVKPGFVL